MADDPKLTGWQIAARIRACFDEDTGEIDTDAEEVLQVTFGEKIEGYGHMAREYEGWATIAKTEAKRQAEMAAKHLAKAAQIRDRAQYLMEAIGKTKVETPTCRAVIQLGSERVVIDDEMLLAEEYRVWDPAKFKPEKSAIKGAIREGREVPGAHLERGPSTLKFK